MRLLFVIPAAFILIIGCRKNDIQIIRGKLVKCDVAEQTNISGVYLVGFGFAKTYYQNGLVKSVRTKTVSAFNDFDSLRFNFTYNRNIVKVTGDKLNYQYHSDGNGGDVHFTNDFPPVTYNFEVAFDPKTLNAIKAGNTTFNYDNNGRLLNYDGFTLLYDDRGNILRVNGDAGLATIYEYDYSTTAKQQLYYTTGYMSNEMFNLMEIMGWIPVQPKNLRIRHILSIGIDDNGDDTLFGTFFFTEHTVDQDGVLTSFNGSFCPGPSGNLPTVNKWICRPVFRGNLK